MPSPPPFTSAEPPHVSELALTLLTLTMHALDRDGVDTAQATRAQTRPRRPEHARTCPWTRQDAVVPRRLSSPSLSPCTCTTPLDLKKPQDNPIGSPSPCRRRHRRRPSATVRQYTVTCRLLLTTPDLAWMRVVITVTPGTRRAHSLPLHRPGTATPPSTSPAPRSTPGPYKRSTIQPPNSTPFASPHSSGSPIPLPLSDSLLLRRNLAGARRCSSSTPPTIPSTPGAAATLLRLVVLDNVDCPPL
jgi:hypothetical protein